MKDIIKSHLPNFLFFYLLNVVLIFRLICFKKPIFYCKVCEQKNRGYLVGLPPTFSICCVNCSSLSRQRMLADYLAKELVFNKKILHFAPEIGLMNFIKKLNPDQYICGDLNPKSNHEKINIEKINYPDNYFDLIIASHVLEHVDDNACLSELRRVIKKNGRVLLMFPVINSWDKTYKNEKIVKPYERELHFGQFDHVRYYGNDVEDLFINHGFQFEKIIADGEDSVNYGLERGETIYVLS